MSLLNTSCLTKFHRKIFHQKRFHPDVTQCWIFLVLYPLCRYVISKALFLRSTTSTQHISIYTKRYDAMLTTQWHFSHFSKLLRFSAMPVVNEACIVLDIIYIYISVYERYGQSVHSLISVCLKLWKFASATIMLTTAVVVVAVNCHYNWQQGTLHNCYCCCCCCCYCCCCCCANFK